MRVLEHDGNPKCSNDIHPCIGKVTSLHDTEAKTPRKIDTSPSTFQLSTIGKSYQRVNQPFNNPRPILENYSFSLLASMGLFTNQLRI